MLKDTLDPKYSLDYPKFSKKKKKSFISTVNVYWYKFVCVLKNTVALLCYYSLLFGTKFYLLLSQIFWGTFHFRLKVF